MSSFAYGNTYNPTYGISQAMENNCRKDKYFEILKGQCLEMEVGDNVLLSAWLLGRGSKWERIKAVITDSRPNSIKVTFKKDYGSDSAIRP